jgi:hypothetical protein
MLVAAPGTSTVGVAAVAEPAGGARIATSAAMTRSDDLERMQ